MREAEAVETANFITDALQAFGDEERLAEIEGSIRGLARRFPPYPEGFIGYPG
jgi:hypothetical protein